MSECIYEIIDFPKYHQKNWWMPALLLFEGIEGIPMCALFFPLEFEGKIH